MRREPAFVAPRRLQRLTGWLAICAALLVVASPERCRADNALDGARIYAQKCASCHGANGEGVKEHYGKALIGDRTLPELTKVIVETMPEGEPENCVGPEAEAVAQYIYDRFYSEIAQYRNRPASIDLSRLTVRQYENSVADLLRSFRGWSGWNNDRGLKAEYFNARNFSRDKRVIERRDAVVDYDFGEESPEAEKIGKEEFAIKWEGSLLAPETGIYEFVIHTENAARLFVNNTQVPVVDAWVRSGADTEFRGEVRLLGGRVYPLRLEFMKFKEPRASIRMAWKPPHHAEEIIPERVLCPQGASSTFVLTTPFPPDDRSTGFERGTSISKEWSEATTFAAIEVAAYVANHLRDVVDLRSGGRGEGRRDGAGATADDAAQAERDQKLREFCVQFASRAFRRPLSDEERALYVDRQFDSAPNSDAALKRVILLVLKSPRFLYREAGREQFDDYDVAAWLSFTLWDSLPDQPLLDAAQRGQLQTREQVKRQVDRMLGDLRTKAKVREFLHQWLKVDQHVDLAKDRQQFPEFTDSVISDLRTSLDLFLDDVVWSESSDFRRLLTSESIPMNERLAKFYNVDLPAEGPPFQEVRFESDLRAGLLSHPYLLSAFAYDRESSPIHRGVWLSRNVLGRILNPPPVAVAPIPPELHAGLTTRERVDLQTSPALCVKCHQMINPLGYPLEHFDAVGRLRDTEHGKPIDASGSYVTKEGQQVEFTGVRELARFLVDSPEVHAAFTEKLFNYLVKQPIRAFGPDLREQMGADFASHGCNIRRLIAEIATTSALGARDEHVRRATARSQVEGPAKESRPPADSE